MTRPVALGGESCRRALSSAPSGLTSARNRTDGLGKILATQVVKGVLCAARDVKRNFGALRAIAIAAAARYPRHRRRKPLQRADWHDWAPTPNAQQDLRCPSCGGPSLDGDRCQACQQPSPSVERGELPAPPIDTSTASAKAQPVAEGFGYTPETSTAPSSGPSTGVAPRKTERLRARRRATTTSVMDKVAGAGAAPAGREAAKTEAMPVKRTKGDAVHSEKAPKPAFVDARKSVAVMPQRRRSLVLPAAAVLVVAALGVGAYWLRHHEEPVIAPAEQPATVVARRATEVADADDRAVRERRAATTTTAIQDRERTPTASLKASAPRRPKPTTPATPSGATVPAVAKVGGVQNSPHESSAVPKTSASAPVIAPPVADVAATAPMPGTPETPIAPFFETRDVNESPRIERRVEPRGPGSPQGELEQRRGRRARAGFAERASVAHQSAASSQGRDRTGHSRSRGRESVDVCPSDEERQGRQLLVQLWCATAPSRVAQTSDGRANNPKSY